MSSKTKLDTINPKLSIENTSRRKFEIIQYRFKDQLTFITVSKLSCKRG